MEARKERAHAEAMEHMKKATELLKNSVAVHHAEQEGRLSHTEAIPIAVALNEQASKESDQAAQAIRQYLDEDPKSV